MVKNNAYQSSQEYFGELDSKFGYTLEDKEYGIKQIIKYLEEKFKVSQHSEDISPYTVAFKKNSQNPSFSQFGDIEQIQDISAKLASHHSATIHTNNMNTSLEDQSDFKKDLAAKKNQAKKNQANVVKHDTYQSFPENLEELDYKLEDLEEIRRRNLYSTSDDAIEKNNLPDIQMVQQKEKQHEETTNESSTVTAINTLTAAKPLDEIVINNNSTTPIPVTISKFNVETTKIFTPEKEKEADNVMMINIPCSRHEEGRCFEAKT